MNNIPEYLIQHSLKSVGSEAHFRLVKVPGTTPYWKACLSCLLFGIPPWVSNLWSSTCLINLNSLLEYYYFVDPRNVIKTSVSSHLLFFTCFFVKMELKSILMMLSDDDNSWQYNRNYCHNYYWWVISPSMLSLCL